MKASAIIKYNYSIKLIQKWYFRYENMTFGFYSTYCEPWLFQDYLNFTQQVSQPAEEEEEDSF